MWLRGHSGAQVGRWKGLAGGMGFERVVEKSLKSVAARARKSQITHTSRHRGRDSVQKTKCPKLHRQPVLNRWKLLAEASLMTARAGVWKRKREDLRNRRTPLFKRYEKSPNDLSLAFEIRIIDDQIAECTQQMERENGKLEPVLAV